MRNQVIHLTMVFSCFVVLFLALHAAISEEDHVGKSLYIRTTRSLPHGVENYSVRVEKTFY